MKAKSKRYSNTHIKIMSMRLQIILLVSILIAVTGSDTVETWCHRLMKTYSTFIKQKHCNSLKDKDITFEELALFTKPYDWSAVIDDSNKETLIRFQTAWKIKKRAIKEEKAHKKQQVPI